MVLLCPAQGPWASSSLDFDPIEIIERSSPFIIYSLYVKFENYCSKTVAYIVHTRFDKLTETSAIVIENQ